MALAIQAAFIFEIGDPIELYPIADDDIPLPFIDIVVIGIPAFNILLPKLGVCGEQEFIDGIETQFIE